MNKRATTPTSASSRSRREERLAAALRENLKRRKLQERERGSEDEAAIAPLGTPDIET